MSNILSQDEVDALLKGVQSGDIEAGSGKNEDSAGVRPYDLAGQERIVRGRMPGLEIANERFARFFRNSVSSLMKRFVDVNINNTGVSKFGEFMKTIPVPSSINIFRMEPLKGYAVLVLEAPLVFTFLELFFGGGVTQHTKTEGRSFTAIEQRIIKKMVNTSLSDLASAWSGLAAVKPEHVGSEMNPQFVTIIMPGEIVLRTEVHIEVEGFTGKLFLAIPRAMVEPIKEKLYSGIQGDRLETDQRWVAGLRDLLMDSAVNISAELARFTARFGEIMSLKEGDVITLGTSSSDELVIRVEDVPKFRGLPGNSRGNQALKITRTY